MARAYIALGSNLGDRAANLNAALTTLNASHGVRLSEYSSFHDTAPVGGPPGQHNYLNAAAALTISLKPNELLQLLLSIERQYGRERGEKNSPRTLDLDLLLFDDLIESDSDLVIPHPRMTEREFVLAPLAEVAPEAVHPASGLRVRELLSKVRGHQPSPFRLDGIRAMVTGATGGIGKATALALAGLGADILIFARDKTKANALACELTKFGRRCYPFIADLTDPRGFDSFVDHVWLKWQGVDVLVNIAGADVLTGPAKDWTFDKKLLALWTLDVETSVRLSRGFGEQMQRRGRGVIIDIGWDQAETGMEGDSGQLFAATKGAVMAFTKSLAKTLAPAVRVNCVAPGWIKTAWGESASAEWQQRVLSETPLRRWGTPEDVANTICWLASPAAAYVTGQVIRVNGGAV
jgi:2-amino-4-hydroxy-6-hydroxymethyldihydropteridine diphosphokinase